MTPLGCVGALQVTLTDWLSIVVTDNITGGLEAETNLKT